MVAVSGNALIGWLIILWGAWLLHANTAVFSKSRAGTVNVTRGVWRRIDNNRLLDVFGFLAGILLGPKLVALATGVVGGLLAGVTLSWLGLSLTEIIIAAGVALVVGMIARRYAD